MSEIYYCIKCDKFLLIPGKCGQCGNDLVTSEELAEATACVIRHWAKQDKAKADAIKINQGGSEKRV